MLVVLPSLIACAPDLARLETEEASLAREVEVLRRNVDEMRSQMEEMGLRPAGPAAGQTDLAGAGADLDDSIAVTVTRTGDGPTFPPLGAPERRASTECGWRFPTAWLEGLSDSKLDETGAGKSSPIQVQLDGSRLEAHATAAGAEKSCRFAFSHRPKYLFVTPANTPDNVAGTWTMGLSPDFPMKTGEGDVYWVYPGTTLTVAFATGWNGEEWGPPSVRVDARNVYVGEPDRPTANSGAPSVISFLGKDVASKELQVGVDELVEPPDGAWTLEISSPSDGPYVFVKSVAVASPTHRRVVIAAKGGK
jgi:hypothetical protein